MKEWCEFTLSTVKKFEEAIIIELPILKKYLREKSFPFIIERQGDWQEREIGGANNGGQNFSNIAEIAR